MVVGWMQLLQLSPVNTRVNTIPFQNFVLYFSLADGVLFGSVCYVVFRVLYRRFQYPASSGLGAWIGAIGGGCLCFSTYIIMNAFAPSFDYIRAGTFTFTSAFTSIVGAMTGMVAGYFIAEIGARNLHYR